MFLKKSSPNKVICLEMFVYGIMSKNDQEMIPKNNVLEMLRNYEQNKCSKKTYFHSKSGYTELRAKYFFMKSDLKRMCFSSEFRYLRSYEQNKFLLKSDLKIMSFFSEF